MQKLKELGFYKLANKNNEVYGPPKPKPAQVKPTQHPMEAKRYPPKVHRKGEIPAGTQTDTKHKIIDEVARFHPAIRDKYEYYDMASGDALRARKGVSTRSDTLYHPSLAH